MSKMGNWVIEMQEAAEDMSLTDFCNQYGKAQLHIWEEVNGFRIASQSRPVQHVNSGYGDEIPF